MQTAKATVRKVKTGYVLVPINNAALPIVAYLYCPLDNAVEMYKRDKQEGVMNGHTMREFINHVIEVAKGDKIRVKIGGTTRRPILKLYPEIQSKHIPVIKRTVDLKWSAWSKHVNIWEDYAGKEIIAEMRAAFSGDGPPVEISSGPRKECRCGSVTISKGKAEGHFSTSWYEIDDLADTLGLLDEEGHWIDRTGMDEEELSERDQEEWDDMDRQAFAESIPFSSYSYEPGVDQEFVVEADSFDDMMEKVDNEEDELLAEDERQWKEIESLYKKADNE